DSTSGFMFCPNKHLGTARINAIANAKRIRDGINMGLVLLVRVHGSRFAPMRSAFCLVASGVVLLLLISDAWQQCNRPAIRKALKVKNVSANNLAAAQQNDESRAMPV